MLTPLPLIFPHRTGHTSSPSRSAPFCGNCDRVRLTADGKFRNCLFAVHETDLRALLRASAGHIINVTSDAAVEGYEGWGGYGSSKAAFEQWSRVLAAEEPAVRVWWVDPGDMNTRMHQEAFPGEDISDRPPPEASVPGLLALIDHYPPSGRYRVADLLAEAAPVPV